MIKMEEKENMLKEWCDRLIKSHEGKAPLNDKMKVDGAKMIKARLDAEGYDKLRTFVRESYQKMKGNNMMGPYLLANFYKEVLNKMWSIDRKCKKKE